MTDVTGLALSGVGVIGAALLGSSFGMPDWVVLGVASCLGSGLSVYWKWKKDEILSFVRDGIGVFLAGGITGIAIAKLIAILSGFEAEAVTWAAFFFAHIGADFSKKLSGGGDGLSASLFDWLKALFSR